MVMQACQPNDRICLSLAKWVSIIMLQYLTNREIARIFMPSRRGIRTGLWMTLIKDHCVELYQNPSAIFGSGDMVTVQSAMKCAGKRPTSVVKLKVYLALL
jgi:hypothetical protein